MIKKSGADKRKGKLNNAGFSLVEVLVAMAVLAILSIPVLGSFSNAARINHKARKEENANTVASDIVEQFKSVSMSRILEDYAGKYTESSGKYIFRETKEGTNGEEYTVVTELDPGIYNSGDDSDKNYNNNINSYVNSVKNIVLREDLYSHDIDAENYFKERYTAGFDKNKIEKTTNVIDENSKISDNKYIQDASDNAVSQVKEEVLPEQARNIAVNVVYVATALILFIVSKIVLSIVISLANAIASLPILKQFNEIGGFLYGLVRGAIISLVLILVIGTIAKLNPNGSLSKNVESTYLLKEVYGSIVKIK